MVNTLRRFGQPLMIVFTVLIIISFAWWTPNWSARSGKNAPVTVIRGKPVHAEEWRREGRSMLIQAQLGGGYVLLVDPHALATMQEERRVNPFVNSVSKISPEGVENSLLFESECAALGITATQQEIEQQLISTPAFLGRDGKFDSNLFDIAMQRILMPEGFSKTQIDQFLAAEVRAQKIAALLASTMPATPSEIRDEFVRERLTTEASYVAFKAADFRAAQKVTEDEIKKRYEEKKDFLKSPEKRKVRFAAFTPPPTPDGKPLEGAQKTDALQKAAEAAYDFVTTLQKPGVNFDEIAKQAGATLGETKEFFSRDAGPAELDGSPVAAEKAFELTKDKPYSAHISIDGKGTYVLVFKETKAPEQLPLDQVRKQLEDELIGEKADEAMMKKAREVRAKLIDARKNAKSFSEAAQSLGLSAVAFPAFSNRQFPPPKTDYEDIVPSAAGKLAPGEIGDVVPTAGAALIVHVDQRPAVDEKGMDEAKARIAEQIQFRRQLVAFHAWIADRREAAGLKPRKERE